MSNLHGKIYICTGELSSSNDLHYLLQNEQAEALIFPMIEIQPLKLEPSFCQIFDEISAYDWILFTSKNGVHSFFNLLEEYTGDTVIPEHVKIASIGPKTTKIIESYGHTADFIGEKYSSKDFIKEFEEHVPKEEISVLFPTGNLTQNMISLNTQDYISIHKIITYNTEPPTELDKNISDAITQKKYNHIIFTSPSGIRNFVNAFKNSVDLQDLHAVSIGPATTRQMKDLGFEPEIIAEQYNNEGIIEALKKNYL